MNKKFCFSIKYFVKLLFLSLCIAYFNDLYAQSNSPVELVFCPSFNQKSLLTEDERSKQSDTIDIEILKCYISSVELFQGKELVFSENRSFHLLDIADSSSLLVLLYVPDDITFSKIKFNVGVDSLTSVSGAFGGDLDPGKGMYWTWQSGYINFKLEGKAQNCPARHHRFQYHIGGYQYPYNTLQTVELEISDTNRIDIDLAIDNIFAQISVEHTYQIMSPNEKALKFSRLLPSLFSVLK